MSALRKLRIRAGAVLVIAERVLRMDMNQLRDLDVNERGTLIVFPDNWTPEEVARVVSAARPGKD